MKDGEAGFLQARAMVSDQLASETVVVEKTVANPEAMAGIFSEKQMNELLFCDQKKLKSQVESLLLGVLVPADVTPELTNQALEYAVKFRKNQRERLREQANVQKRTSGKSVSRLISTKCLCDESGWGDIICDTLWTKLPFCTMPSLPGSVRSRLAYLCWVLLSG